jgi:hypothetical protein
VFSKLFALADTDNPQICVAVSKRAGTDSSEAAHQYATPLKNRAISKRSRWLGGLRDFETIDAELWLLAVVSWSIREDCGERST